MKLFNRTEPPAPQPAADRRAAVYATRPSAYEAKAAELHPTVVETLRLIGGGSYFNAYGQMYRCQPAVRSIVDFLARNIAQLNAKSYLRVSSTDRQEVDHPLSALLRNPNPATSRFAHMRDTVSDLATYDRAYWRKVRVGRLFAVVRIPPAKIYADVDYETGKRIYRDVRGGTISRDSLVIFRGYSPDDDTEGVSPLETLRRVMQEEWAAVQHREGMWRNSARQSGWVQRPNEAPEWSDIARERFRTDMEATMAGGTNAGRIGVLEDGMTWNGTSFSPEQTQYVEGRRLTYEEVVLTYFGPLVGQQFLKGGGTAGDEAHRQVYQDVLGPWLRFLQDEIELQLMPEYEFVTSGSVYIEFNLSDKLKGSFEEQGKVLVTSTGVPYITVNEARARVNLPRIDAEWADKPVQPLNVMYGGQPAPTVPTADRSTPPSLQEGKPNAAPKALPQGKAVAPPAPPAAAVKRRDAAALEHADFFREYFERQARTILSAKAVVDRDRWNTELTADLFLLASRTARVSGRLAAQQLKGVYDEQRTLGYLSEDARIAAENINDQTFEALDASLDNIDRRQVFEEAKGARADQLGLSRATALIGFARNEAAIHTQAADGVPRMKTWVVTSPHSRHPHMSGETVPVNETFSNGAMWPGGGTADQAAGCKCLLSIETQ